MKKITKTIIALSVLAGLASCAKEQTPVSPEVNDGKVDLTLSAEQEYSETRAAIDGTDKTQIDWTTGDRLSVLELYGTANNEFTLTGGAGTKNGTFSGTVSSTASILLVVYPYSSSLSLSGLSLSGAELASDQAATEGSFDPKSALMAGVGSAKSASVQMNNVVGYVKVTPNFDCKKITLESKSADDKLSGKVSVSYDMMGKSLTYTYSEASNKVSISGDIKAGKTYYIAVLPVELSSGFKLIFTMKDGAAKYLEDSGDSAKILKIEKSKVKNLGTWNEGDLKDDGLSANGTANCYLVPGAGNYKFLPVKGNTNESVGTVTSVEVLWESDGTTTAPAVGEIISSVSYSDGYIQFSATSSEGNAVIAAKDASGKILWSWHIWCAESWNEQTYWVNKVSGTKAGTMMDRNLGATTARSGKVGSLGLFYQWGRKDPFLGSASVNSADQATSTGDWFIKDDATSAESAIQNPTTFYTNYTYGSWASKKSVNDPCPAGWRVPDGGSDGIWAKASGQTDVISVTGTYGLNFSNIFGSDATIWYPCPGYLDWGYGNLRDVGYGCYWSATLNPNDSGSAYYLYMLSGTGALPSNSDKYASGNSVRCCKE